MYPFFSGFSEPIRTSVHNPVPLCCTSQNNDMLPQTGKMQRSRRTIQGKIYHVRCIWGLILERYESIRVIPEPEQYDMHEEPPSQGLFQAWRGSIVYITIFMVREWTTYIHVWFNTPGFPSRWFMPSLMRDQKRSCVHHHRSTAEPVRRKQVLPLSLSEQNRVFHSVSKEILKSHFFIFFWLWQNSFTRDMKFRTLVRMKEGTVPFPPCPPALRDDDVAPVRELSQRGSHSGGGETPVSV